MPLPGGFYINAYRSGFAGQVGVQVRIPGPEGQAAYEALAAERDAIQAALSAAELPELPWEKGDVPSIMATSSLPPPWAQPPKTPTSLARARDQRARQQLCPRRQALSQEGAA